MWHIERNEVVPQEKRRPLAKFVQTSERLGEIAALMRKRFSCISAYGRKPADSVVVWANFEVDG